MLLCLFYKSLHQVVASKDNNFTTNNYVLDMKSITSSADKLIEAPRIAKNKPQAGPMTRKKTNGIQSDPPEGEYIESILEILDREMAVAETNPTMNNTSGDMDLLVADLLGYLKIED
jgi:hypothetical protein